MTLLQPLGLLGLIGLPAILLIHWLRGSRRRLVVPAGFLWANLPSQALTASRWRRPPFTLALLLQLLAVALASTALARPVLAVPPPRHLALVLDASASMQATDVAGQPGRFELARAKALARLAALGPGDRATLVRAGTRAELVADGSPAGVQVALAALRPGVGRAAVREALALAGQELARTPEARPELVILTDGALQPFVPAGTLPTTPTWDLVGGGAANQGIVGLVARQQPDGSALEALVDLQNADAQAVRVPLQALADDLEIDTRTVDLPARGRVRVTLPLPAQAARLTVRLGGHDALAQDDQAEIALPGGRTRQVLLVSRRPEALQRALSALSNVRVRPLDPSQFQGQPADLTVLDGALPEPPPSGPLLLVNPPPGSSVLEVGPPLGVGPLLAAPSREPLLDGIDLAALRVDTASRIVPPAWAHVVLAAQGSPLLLEGRRDGRPIVALAFDPAVAGLDKTLAFPLLISNAAQVLLSGGLGPSVTPDQDVTLPAPAAPAAGGSWTLLRPDGRREPLASSGGVLHIGSIDQVGRYQVVDGQDGTPRASFAVNLLDASETDVAPRPVPDLPVVSAPSPPRATFELWPFIAALALGLLALEWLHYVRRA